MANVLITGASGLIGKTLSDLLLKNGHTVTHLGRKENLKGNIKCYSWDIEKEKIDIRAFDNIDTVIHLAGAGLAEKRWTQQRKKEIIDSRVKSGQMLIHEVNKRSEQIKTFIGASAIGYYGAITNDTIYNEEMPPYNDFMATVCRLWEESYTELDRNVRKVVVRIGVVLSNNGGALQKLSATAKKGLAAPLGRGKQFMPWIHIDDITALLYDMIIHSRYNGIYNAVAPQHISNKEFTYLLSAEYDKKVLLPGVPGFILKLLLGEMAVMVLEGSRVSCTKISGAGFTFSYPEISGALKNLIREK